MVNVGLPVREVSVHGYSVKDEHPADEKDADPLEPPERFLLRKRYLCTAAAPSHSRMG